MHCQVTGNECGTDTRPIGRPCSCPTCVAADEITRLRSAVRELREALEPLGEAAIEEIKSCDHLLAIAFKSDFEKARSALFSTSSILDDKDSAGSKSHD
jgi:hypothetical protein